MNTIFVVALLLCVVSKGHAEYHCYAHGVNYGKPCSSPVSVVGRPGHRIMYSVTVQGHEHGTNVCCQGYSPSKGDYVWIGCGHASGSGTTTFSKSVDWGNHTEHPKIRCKGNPYGTSVTWSHRDFFKSGQ